MPDTTFRAFVSIRSRETGATWGHRWSLAVASPTAAGAAPTFARWARLWEAVAPPGIEYRIEGIYPASPDPRGLPGLHSAALCAHHGSKATGRARGRARE